MVARRSFGPLLVGTLALVAAGCGNGTALLSADDFGHSASGATKTRIGVPGTPPCRALHEFVSDLNIGAEGRFTGIQVDLKGRGQVFAVLFDKDATPPSANHTMTAASKEISTCISEVRGDPDRSIELIADLPPGAVGARATESGTATDYAFVVTKNGRLLVVGDQYSAANGAPKSTASLLKLVLGRADSAAQN